MTGLEDWKENLGEEKIGDMQQVGEGNLRGKMAESRSDLMGKTAEVAEEKLEVDFAEQKDGWNGWLEAESEDLEFVSVVLFWSLESE